MRTDRVERKAKKKNGVVPEDARIRITRRHTKAGEDPFDQVEWELRTATISGEKGEIVFEQKDVEVPKAWTQMATNVVVSKYFRGKLGTPQRERSVRQLIGRVVDTITQWGLEGKYFEEKQAEIFRDELKYLLLHQRVAFNSPVWFNVGVEKHPQCSACFINSVDDSMASILDLAKTEGMLFKYGSGTGSNLSSLRSSREHLAGGGTASGPVSFMKGYDAFAGVIKSGGKTRRAAKMVILNVDHPDIMEFIKSKADEEKKAWALIEEGYDGGFNVPGGAYDSVFFQNANHSVRVTDDFMRVVVEDNGWTTKMVTDGSDCEHLKARDVWGAMADAAWVCGDPGVQFDTIINDWHTCPNTDRIHASNPCSEYMFLNNSACNLASLNLMKFRRADGSFDVEDFKHAVETTFLGMEILVGFSSYPRKEITENSHAYRPLGLGYANLGAFLMSIGVPYDSNQGRAIAGAVTALMTGHAYASSARFAAHIGPFEGYKKNAEPMLRVIGKHRKAVRDIDRGLVNPELYQAAKDAWDEALDLGELYGYRNAQASVLAPTGTIGFMMDCDTTGIEPDLALVKYKKLVGGGLLKIVNNTVPMALERLGYDKAQRTAILKYIDTHGTIEGAPGLDPEHLAVFDCAFKPANGERSIQYMGHVRMMAAAQPFLSGAISKTVNMPADVTPQNIADTYLEAWRLGLKAIAIYRDGCKRTQPMSTSTDAQRAAKQALAEAGHVERRRLPDERASITHKFSISGHEGYITVGMYEDGSPGEVFVVMSKEGSTLSGVMDSFATAISLAFQHGVPLRTLVQKFSHSRYEPSGFTNNPRIPIAKSVTDYMFRWLADKFLSTQEKRELGIHGSEIDGEEAEAEAAAQAAETASEEASEGDSSERAEAAGEQAEESYAPGREVDVSAPHGDPLPAGGGLMEKAVFKAQADAPPCPTCGAIMVRNAACYKCLNCGTTSGCS